MVDFHPTEPWALSALYSGNIFIWDYNTQTLVKQLEVCNLPVRCAKFVTRKQWIITASDDMTIKLWDWEKNWACSQVFEGHAHYVMMCQWNPKDNTIFASCSLDRSIKVWGITGSNSQAHFTLSGHKKGVNCLEYAPTGEKPYIISGADDQSVCIWDYQTKQCIQTLRSHTN